MVVQTPYHKVTKYRNRPASHEMSETSHEMTETLHEMSQASHEVSQTSHVTVIETRKQRVIYKANNPFSSLC